MEEKLIDRIGDEYLNGNFQDGQILLNSDVNEIVSIVKEGINANFNDIQKIQNGSHQVGNAKQLDGADLSRFSDGEMVGSDKLIPTSQQVKSYVDSKVQEIKDTTEVGKLVEDLNALGIEVGNKVDKTDLVNEETTGEDKAYNCDYINELFENGVGDSLPIGTIVEYTGENIPDGFEEVIEPEDATVYVGPTEPTGGQDVWIQKGKNLFNPDSHIVSNGTFYDWNNGSSATNNEYYGVKIPVLPNTVYVSSSDLEPGYWSSLCYWDKDMNFISGAAYNANYKGITTPSNCAYITFALMKTYNWFQLEQGSTVTEYEPYIEKKVYIKTDNGGYEEFYNEEVDTVVRPLMSSSVQMMSGKSVALNDAIENYDYIEVICCRGTDYGASSTKVRIAASVYPTVTLYFCGSAGISVIPVKFKLVDKTIMCTNLTRYTITSSGVDISTEGEDISLHAVIGYKYKK